MTTSDIKKDKISSIIRACRLITRMNQARPGARKSEAMYYQMLANYYNRVQKAKEEGNFLAAHTVFFPAEILYAMDIVPMHTEMTTWLTALFLREQVELLAAGVTVGLGTDGAASNNDLDMFEAMRQAVNRRENRGRARYDPRTAM